MKLSLLVMAAGIGSRYGGLKQMDGFGPSGEAIIDYSIYDAIRAGFNNVIFIIRKDIEADFREFFLKKLEHHIEVDFVFQELDMIPRGFTVPGGRVKPWGTGHAVLVASEKIDNPFVVINGDDYYGPESYRLMAGFLSTEAVHDRNHWAMVGYELQNTLSKYGTVARGVCETEGEYLKSIREITDIGFEATAIGYKDGNGLFTRLDPLTPVSMNIWGFTPSVFAYLSRDFKIFLERSSTYPKAEFYIPTLINNLINTKECRVKVLTGGGEWFGVTYREDRPRVISRLNDLIEKGVYPSSLWANR